MSGHRSLDRAGMLVSGACAVHCAVTPLVVALLPLSAAAGIMGSAAWEGTVLTVAILLGSASLAWGFRIHGHKGPALVLLLGIALVVTGHTVLGHGNPIETPVVVLGAVIMAAAHGWNLRHCLRCQAHGHEEHRH